MKTWLTALFLCAAMFAFGQGTAARRDANLSDMVNVNTARSNILAHIATNITIGTIPDSRFPVVLQSLATNNAATLTNLPWATGISGIPAGFADGVDDTAVGAATAFTNATIGYGDQYRTNYISIATAGATNVGTLYSTRFGIADAVLNSWDDVTNYFAQTGSQTNIIGSFSNSYSIGTINSSNVFQIQTTNATLAFQVSTNADIRMVGNAFLSGGAVLGDSMEGDAVDIILTGGGSFIGDGGQLTGLNPTNINSGYSSGLSIGGNAATATTAATANAADNAAGYFPGGQLEPTLFASNSPSANLILKATSATTAAWSAEAAGPTNIVNDGEYVRITDTNGVTRFQVNSNWTRLIDGDGNVVLVATDSYGSQLQSGNNTYITLTNNAGIFYKATMHTFNGDVSFQNISFQTATFTNAVFATNMPPATISPGDGAVLWNSNNAALYWVSYGNDGNPVATNAFGTGAATASTNLSNLTVTNSFIGTNVQTAGLTNNGTARVNGDLTVTGAITADVVDFTTMNVTNAVLTSFTNTPFLGVDENGLLAAAYDGNVLTNLNGTNIVVDAAGFNGNLATTDTNLQQIAQAVDDLVLGGATGMLTNQFTTNVVGSEIVGLVKLAALQISGPQTNTATGTIWNSAGTHYITNNANGFGIDTPPISGVNLVVNGQVQAGGLTLNGAFNMSNPSGIFNMFADTNNWAPSSTSNFIRMTNATAGTINITGLASQAQAAQGRRVILHNMSELAAATITLKHEDANSTAANRFRCPGATDYILKANGWVEIMTVTDGTAYRWYLNAN